MSSREKPTAAVARRKTKARHIVRLLRKHYGDVECALVHDSAYQLVVATILSAQCTDERVNATTPELFRRYPTAHDLAEATQPDVESIVRSLGFFRAKATNIRGMARRLVDEFNGDLPQDIDSMISLPGVGRKTASVVLGTWYGIPSGVVVDTHVKRITRLLGLTREATPEKIERDLMALVPQNEWINFSHRLIHHGRRICIARRPKCTECPLIKYCDRVDLPALT